MANARSSQLDREIAAALSKGLSEGWYVEDDRGTKHVFYGPFASKEAAYRAAFYRNAINPDYEEMFLAASRALHVDSDMARYLRDAPEDVFGKGAQVVQRPPSKMKVHPSWRGEWHRWKQLWPALTYVDFQDRLWANVWAKKIKR